MKISRLTPKAERTGNVALIGVVLLVLAFLAWTLPARAADLPPPPPKEPPVKLYIYPKLLPPQQGEVIIRDPSRPEVDTTKWAFSAAS